MFAAHVNCHQCDTSFVVNELLGMLKNIVFGVNLYRSKLYCDL